MLEFGVGGGRQERKEEKQCSQAWRTLKRKQWCKREREREGIYERLWTRNARISWSEQIALNNDYVTWWGPYALGFDWPRVMMNRQVAHPVGSPVITTVLIS